MEFKGPIRSAKLRLTDAQNNSLSAESRFDLAYNVAHSLALAALRNSGYRSENRYIVFQLLAHSLNLGPEVWRIFAKSHDCRNLAEYERYFDVNEQLLNELIHSTEIMLNKPLESESYCQPDSLTAS